MIYKWRIEGKAVIDTIAEVDDNRLSMLELIMEHSSFTYPDLISMHELEFFKMYKKCQERARQKTRNESK